MSGVSGYWVTKCIGFVRAIPVVRLLRLLEFLGVLGFIGVTRASKGITLPCLVVRMFVGAYVEASGSRSRRLYVFVLEVADIVGVVEVGRV